MVQHAVDAAVLGIAVGALALVALGAVLGLQPFLVDGDRAHRPSPGLPSRQAAAKAGS